jgi:hypothetical protein
MARADADAPVKLLKFLLDEALFAIQHKRSNFIENRKPGLSR